MKKPEAPKPGPAYCGRPVKCEACPYPQPCDAQTVRHDAALSPAS